MYTICPRKVIGRAMASLTLPTPMRLWDILVDSRSPRNISFHWYTPGSGCGATHGVRVLDWEKKERICVCNR